MRVAKQIELKLQENFDPRELEVVDESHLHVGHAGAPEGGQSHFRVRMRSQALAGMSRVAQHRKVNAALSDELATQVHALALDLGA
ncbi:BolA family protein [Roseobacter sp. HKCCA0434]|uniref:BolA family protein n=1 Tax=Roseobacter sp. HKCCA0434 TaxID=3079297 RepID=UPI002905DBA6|nr:BolA family protein [Roseobacter sp. HKCCA0434]